MKSPSSLLPREIAPLALLSALWSIIEVAVGFSLKAWRVPFTGSFLAAVGVVMLIVGRAFVPRRGTAILMGILAALLKGMHLGPMAIYGAIAILAESTLVELSLWNSSPGRFRHVVAGILALLWALIHPFFAQGLLAGWGLWKVYALVIVRSAALIGTEQVVFVLAFLVSVHLLAGIAAGWFAGKFVNMLGNRLSHELSLSKPFKSPAVTA